MTKRKTFKFKKGAIIDVEEFHDGRYGAPGCKREKKKKHTEEQIRKINAYNKAKRCRQRLLLYFDAGDLFVDLTYVPENRPPNMATAKKHYADFRKEVRKEFKKRGYELFWIRNIERGTKGAWHIHVVVKEIGDTASIIKKAWKHGGVFVSEIKLIPSIYDEDFTKLSYYMTKDEHTREKKANGELAKPKIKEASYSTSRNMPLPEPDVDKLHRWKAEVKPKKGYYIAGIHEGINPVTGYKYRRYTMIRLSGREREQP